MSIKLTLILAVTAIAIALVSFSGCVSKSSEGDLWKVVGAVEKAKPDETREIGNPSEIIALAKNSSCAKVNWKDRGVAPMGYTKGMALMYARTLCNQGVAPFVVMARPKSFEKTPKGYYKDTLAIYDAKFKAMGYQNDKYGVDTFRATSLLVWGLGMRESSGKYCCGRDASMDFTEADSAESGLHQTSFNVITKAEKHNYLAVWEKYKSDQSWCLKEVFKEGVSDKYCATQSKLWGNPNHEGYLFQKIHKQCPALSHDMSAIATRDATRHYGPYRTLSAEIRTECDSLLRQIDWLINEKPEICEQL